MNSILKALYDAVIEDRYQNPNRREAQVIARRTAEQLYIRFRGLVTEENAEQFAKEAF